MFDIQTDEKNNLIIATPTGALSRADFEGLGKTVNDYINRKDRAPGLVLVAEGLPHWKDAAALFAHLELVREHHKVIAKVALVSDSTALSIMPALVDHFVDAKVRHFPQSQLEQAKEWAALVDPTETSIQLMKGLPHDVVAFEVVGALTSRDYEQILTPLIDEKLKEHDKLKVLVVLGEDFEGATAAALWDDARLGFLHMTVFGRVAIVSDLAWIRQSAKVFALLIPGMVHVFGLDELDHAKEWVKW